MGEGHGYYEGIPVYPLMLWNPNHTIYAKQNLCSTDLLVDQQ